MEAISFGENISWSENIASNGSHSFLVEAIHFKKTTTPSESYSF